MNFKFDEVYYEPNALSYPLGEILKKKFDNVPWIPIESHNNILQLRKSENKEFIKLKSHLIIGIRKTHKYVENEKVSDYLVPYTSSGCSAMCLYCYLVCNYNKCSYLRLFVNREQMLDKIIKTSCLSPRPLTFEIGSNSDLLLENQITGNLPWTIEHFAKEGIGYLTFPTKFDMVEPLLHLNHQGKTIFRMSMNPQEIIQKIELGTSSLDARIQTINAMCDAGYPVGILIAPVILVSDWKNLYSDLINQLSEKLSKKVKQNAFIEVIFMTYSFIQNAINTEAFPNAVKLYNKNIMTGRGRGKYCYKNALRAEAEVFLREQLEKKLYGMTILYVV